MNKQELDKIIDDFQNGIFEDSNLSTNKKPLSKEVAWITISKSRLVNHYYSKNLKNIDLFNDFLDLDVNQQLRRFRKEKLSNRLLFLQDYLRPLAFYYSDYKFKEYYDLEDSVLLLFQYHELSSIAFRLLSVFNLFEKYYSSKLVDISSNDDISFNFPFGLKFEDFNNNFNRLLNEEYLTKKLQKIYVRLIEHEKRKNEEVKDYISNYNSKKFDKKRKDQLDKLENYSLFNVFDKNMPHIGNVVKSKDKAISMKDLALKTEQNRLNELFFKSKIVDIESKKRGFNWHFITLTLPTQYHALMKKGTRFNPKFEHDTKKGHEDLNLYWQGVMRYLAKIGLKSGDDYIYITVNEAHKDGCEHRHIMFFCRDEVWLVIENFIKSRYIRTFYPELLPNELSQRQIKKIKKDLNEKAKNKFIRKIGAPRLRKEWVEEQLNKKIESQKNLISMANNERKYKIDVAIKIINEDKDFNEDGKTAASSSSYLFKYLTKTTSDENGEVNSVKKWARINSIRQYHVAGLKLNFQVYSLLASIYKSSQVDRKIEYIDSINPDIEINHEDFKNLFLDPKIPHFEDITSKNIDKVRNDWNCRNYNNLIKMNKMRIQVNYDIFQNKYEEGDLRLSHVYINGIRFENISFYSIMNKDIALQNELNNNYEYIEE